MRGLVVHASSLVGAGLLLCLGCARESPNQQEHEHAELAAEVEALRASVAELSQEVAALRVEISKPAPHVTARFDDRPSGATMTASPSLAALLTAPAKPLPAEPPPVSSSTATPDSTEGIACEPGRCRVPRGLVDRLAQDPSWLAKQCRIVPSMLNGAFDGFKLYAIRPSSFLRALGLANGDRIVAMGGRSLASAEDMLEVYTAVKDSREIPVRLVRRGELFELVIEVRD